MDGTEDHQPGGFLLPQEKVGLPSPSPSTASTQHGATSLPHPRVRSLQPGSSKEDMVRRFVEDKLLQISRRYVKKFGGASREDDIVGYKSFGEVCKDFDSVINVLWLSGTRKQAAQKPNPPLSLGGIVIMPCSKC